MILAFSITDIVAVPFGYVLDWLNRLTGNVGMAVILFAAAISLLMHPLQLKNRINSVKKARLQPKIQAVRAMYPNDLRAQNYIMEKMYEKEKISLAGGCLMSVASMAILIMLFAAVSQPMVYTLHIDKEMTAGIITLLKELDPTAFTGRYDEVVAASLMAEHTDAIKAAYPAISDVALQGLNFNFLGLNLAQLPNINFTSWPAADWAHVGLLLMPVFAALCSALPRIFNMVKRTIRNIKGEPVPAQNSKLSILSPVMTLLFIVACFQVPAALSLYWAVKSLVGLPLNALIRKKIKQLPADGTDLNALAKEYKATEASG